MPNETPNRTLIRRHIVWLLLFWSACVPLCYVLLVRPFLSMNGPVTLDDVGDAVLLPTGDVVVVLNSSQRVQVYGDQGQYRAHASILDLVPQYYISSASPSMVEVGSHKTKAVEHISFSGLESDQERTMPATEVKAEHLQVGGIPWVWQSVMQDAQGRRGKPLFFGILPAIVQSPQGVLGWMFTVLLLTAASSMLDRRVRPRSKAGSSSDDPPAEETIRRT